jgi:deazaflavin-dependent oxidoreductase (nitroreductase family)
MDVNQPTFEREPATWWRRLFLKAPPLVYYGPLAELMRSRCVMVLTTTGRHSGKQRTTGVSFMPLGDRFISFSGWGIRSNWYQNLLANPEATIRVGRRKMRVTAVPVADPARRRELMRQMHARSNECGPPEPVRTLLRVTGLFDYEGELKMAEAQGEALPVVELIPSGETTPAQTASAL